MILGQKIRLDPSNVQATFFARSAGTARFTYNWGLARWQEAHKAGEKPNWRKLDAEINARKKTDLTWMREVSCFVTNYALQDLGKAFTNFFRRVAKQGEKPGYPKFKSKKRSTPAFALAGRDLQFDGKKVKIPKLGWVRTRQEVRFPGKILSARFTEWAGHWYLSIQVEVDESWVYPNRCESQEAVGVDLGVKDLAVLSTGEKIEAPRVLRAHEKRLRMLNKELARRTKGGKNREKTKAKLARLHERISNVRKDTTHKLTARLVRDFGLIGVEDLNIAGMKRGLRLAKSVSDAAMGEVLRQLGYKSVLAGSEVVKADRWFPSTKTCSGCGVVVEKLPLSVRDWSCSACGVVHDRDINAAINLRTVALTGIAQRQGSSGRKPSPVKLPFGWESGIRVVHQDHHGFSP